MRTHVQQRLIWTEWPRAQILFYQTPSRETPSPATPSRETPSSANPSGETPSPNGETPWCSSSQFFSSSASWKAQFQLLLQFVFCFKTSKVCWDKFYLWQRLCLPSPTVPIHKTLFRPVHCPLAKLFVLYDMQETTVDLIEGAGYPAETHHVTTEDGYILAVHRYITQFSFSGDFLLKMFSSEYLNEGVHQCYTSMATSPRLPKPSSRTRASASSWPTRATTSGWSTSEATPTPGTTL